MYYARTQEAGAEIAIVPMYGRNKLRPIGTRHALATENGYDGADGAGA